MAVYTDIADDELAAFIATYDLGQVLSAKGIAEGVENSNYLLRTEKGQFILTLYEKRVKEDDLPFFVALMQHLAAHGLNCPQPVMNKAGKALGRLAERPACIVTFLDGMGVKRPGVTHCAAVGQALADLQRAAQGFTMTRANALSIDGWRPLFEAAEARADSVMPGLRDATEAALIDLEAHWPKDLPQGVIHADLFPDNVFFLGDRLSGLIDFYFACTDIVIYDLAIGLNAWCFEADGSYNITKGRAMIEAYRKQRPLSSAEIEALPILCRGAALRFMLTRLVDWLNVPPGALVRPKDPLEYFRKLRFHLHCNAASDYGLAE